MPLKHQQARLKGRISLCPDIDLASFECGAVIDWLDLSVRTGRPTQGQWINARIEAEHGISVHAKALDDRTTTRFSLRFQEPDLSLVAQALATLDRLYGIEGRVNVVGAEVSVDFYPNDTADDWQRWRLLAVLVRHLLPSRNLATTRGDLPRCNFGEGNRFVFPQKRHGPVVPERFMFNGNDRAPIVDATTYFGAKGSSPSWRVMDKILDRQNKKLGTKVLLSDDQKRVRVEVTLNEQSLREAGIVELVDLGTGALTRLQGRHFRWMLPTFEDMDRYQPGRRRSLATYIQREREQKFLTAGVVGVDLMDRQWTKVRGKHRKDILERGLAAPRRRAGSGRFGDFVAYEELSGKVAMALEKLTHRVRKQLSALTP